MCWLLLCYVAHFVFLKCLHSNHESCRSKQAHYKLSHPYPLFRENLKSCRTCTDYLVLVPDAVLLGPVPDPKKRCPYP